MWGQEIGDEYDLVVIGGGPGGQSAAELAAFLGHTALVVQDGEPGGVVTTTGGVPTKTLREAALYFTGFRQEELYGVRAGLPLAEVLPVIRARAEEVCRTMQQATAAHLAARGVVAVRGRARLRSSQAVEITTPDGARSCVTARAIVLATGSRPAHPAGVPFDDPDVYDSDEIFTLRRVPRDVVVVGGGPVGIEFATVFTALGVPVTLVNHGERLLPTMDQEMVDLLAAECTGRGGTLVVGTGVERVERSDGRLVVTLSTGVRLDTDAVLFAAGRTPNTAGLGLEDVGVEVDGRGRIVVDAYHRTTVDGIYAVGDVIGPALASLAAQQGRAATCHALGLIFGIGVDCAGSSAVYGLPEIAGVGVTEEQLQAEGRPYVAGRCDLATTARGAIAGHGGRLKLLFRPDDRRLLGVHCVGDLASEIVGLGHVALQVGAALDVFLMLALNTPTYGSAYRDAAIDGLARLAELQGHRRPDAQSLAARLADADRRTTETTEMETPWIRDRSPSRRSTPSWRSSTPTTTSTTASTSTRPPWPVGAGAT